MRPRDYIEIITQEMLNASLLFKPVAGVIAATNKVGNLEEIFLEKIKEHLEGAVVAMGKLLEKNPYAYIIITDVFGDRQYIECDSIERVRELAGNFHGDDGKAYIFTNDLNVGGREENIGGTIICENAEQVYEKAEEMLNKK